MSTTTAPRERPILFSAPMVRALLDGRKTQTRRIVKPQPRVDDEGVHFGWASFYKGGNVHTWDEDGVGGQNWNCLEHPSENCYVEALKRTPHPKPCPYGQPGDRLWVREAWRAFGDSGAEKDSLSTCTGPDDLEFFADFTDEFDIDIRRPWRPSIHMPRWARRLTLEITSIRVERVQEISAADAMAEGVQPDLIAGQDIDIDGNLWASGAEKYREAFLHLFYDLNHRAPRDQNPWVWVVAFRRVANGGGA